MTTRNQILRSSTPGAAPAAGTRAPGEMWTTFPDLQLGVIDTSRNAQKLIAVRFFSATAAYSAGDFVVQAGKLYFAKAPVPAGAFNVSQWTQVAALTDIPALYVLPTASTTVLGGVKVDGATITISSGVISSAGLVTVSATAPSPVLNGALWYDLVGGQLYVWMNDGTSSQWVVAVNQSLGGVYLPMSGGTLTGDLILNRDPAVALGACTKQYADTKQTAAQVAASLGSYLPLAGGTLSGALKVTNFIYAVSDGANQTPSLVFTNSAQTTATQMWHDLSQNRFQISNAQVSGVNFLMDGAGVTAQVGPGNFIVNQNNAYKPGGGSWVALSDARIKDVQGDYPQGLDEILKLAPVVYTYKGNASATEDGPFHHEKAAEDKTPFVGLIAQDVEAVFPGMVTQSEAYIDGVKVDDLRSLDASPLIYALVNAVKTLAAEVNALKARGAV